jgi:hypothetical protein
MTPAHYCIPVTLLFLSACTAAAGEEDFPSLAKRAAEDQPFDQSTPVAATPSITQLPADLAAQVAAAQNAGATAHTQFLRNLPAAERQVRAAAGVPRGSEQWVAAQVTLAALEIDTQPSASALSSLDRLYIARRNAELDGAAAGGAILIEKVRSQLAEQVAVQQQSIDALQARLR